MLNVAMEMDGKNQMARTFIK